MSPNEARAQVLHELDAPIHELPGQGTVRILIDHVAGARYVLQRVFRFGLGRTPELRNEHSEEVLYAVSGHGEASLGGEVFIDAERGSRHVTQFVGFIDRSRAPFHTHTYEEALYILEGRGIVHIDDHDLPIERGTSIFLPPGTPHCLENEGPEVLKLLGVFSPPGSPANRMDSPGPGSPGG